MSDPAAFAARKARLRQLVTEMLGALGRKDFTTFETYVADDCVFEWPYLPLSEWDGRMVGRTNFRRSAEFGMADSDPYAYTIESIHDLVEPDAVIAEYTSHSHNHARGLNYSNKYISVFRWDGDLVVFWKEYVNPLIIQAVYGLDFKNPAAVTGAAA